MSDVISLKQYIKRKKEKENETERSGQEKNNVPRRTEGR